jgi:uncharacterized DUF497 family protein
VCDQSAQSRTLTVHAVSATAIAAVGVGVNLNFTAAVGCSGADDLSFVNDTVAAVTDVSTSLTTFVAISNGGAKVEVVGELRHTAVSCVAVGREWVVGFDKDGVLAFKKFALAKGNVSVVDAAEVTSVSTSLTRGGVAFVDEALIGVVDTSKAELRLFFLGGHWANLTNQNFGFSSSDLTAFSGSMSTQLMAIKVASRALAIGTGEQLLVFNRNTTQIAECLSALAARDMTSRERAKYAAASIVTTTSYPI